MEILWKILEIAIPILAPVFVALILALMSRLLKKFGIEESKIAEEIVEKYTVKAINYAEEQAHKYAGTYSGSEKLNMATEMLKGLLENSDIPKKLISKYQTRLVDIIEAKLGEKRTSK